MARANALVNVMFCAIWGPLQGAPPTVATAILSFAMGLGGLVYISFNLLTGKGKTESIWKIVFGFVVFLGFLASGIAQWLKVH